MAYTIDLGDPAHPQGGSWLAGARRVRLVLILGTGEGLKRTAEERRFLVYLARDAGGIPDACAQRLAIALALAIDGGIL